MKSNPTTLTTEDLDATETAKGETARDRSAPDGRKGAGRCLREVLEDEVDDEGNVEALVVGGHDDAVRALAARRRLHGRPTGHSNGSLPLLRRALRRSRWDGSEWLRNRPSSLAARSRRAPLQGTTKPARRTRPGRMVGLKSHGHACEWV